MAKKPSPAVWATMLAVFCIVLTAGLSGPLAPYVAAVKSAGGQPVMPAAAEYAGDDELLRWIRAEAARMNEAPVDAVIDRVWKAVPGYNGRAVDVAATYRQAKAIGFVPGDRPGSGIPWVFRETAPTVSLDDLPLAPIYRGNPAKPMIALMINVAWGDEYLAKMLDTLKENNVRATFFFDGSWLSKHMDAAREIAAAGHELSNHAYTHPRMSALSDERQRREIARTEQLLGQLGVSNRWFAPPSGDYDARTVRIAAEFKLKTVLWTLDTIDWRLPPAASIVAKVSRQAGPGTLILMHPTASAQAALQGIIDAIRARGYEPGTVAQTLSSDRVDVRL